MDTLEIGDLLRKHRSLAHFTQTQLGKMLGYDASYISRIETGVYEPDAAYLEKFCQTLRLTNVDRAEIFAHAQQRVPISYPGSVLQDWGTCPNVVRFYGRSPEVQTLKSWSEDLSVNLVGILGMGGLGKSHLAAFFAEQHGELFDAVVCRSLANPYPALELVHDLIAKLAEQPEQPSSYIGRAVVQLCDILKQKRCLLIFDNFESVLKPNEAGEFRDEFGDYRTLLGELGSSKHRSCILITSRDRPHEFSILEGNKSQIRTLQLSGLDNKATRELLENKRLKVKSPQVHQLHTSYSGNPLALELIGDLIQSTFQGDIGLFLQERPFTFGKLEDVLQEQINHLSSLAYYILFWLAIQRRPLTIQQLDDHISPENGVQDVALEVEQLLRRSLLEAINEGFKLQNFVQSYLINALVKTVVEEIRNDELNTLYLFPLLDTHAPEYIQDAQRREIHVPIIEGLNRAFGSPPVVQRALNRQLRKRQKAYNTRSARYACGNIINLMIEAGFNLSGFDLSALRMSHVDFRDTVLHKTDLSGANVTDCLFNETFGHVLNVAYSPNGRFFAAATTSGAVHVWDVKSLEKANFLQVDNNWVRSIAWHSTEMRLVTCSSGTAQPIIQYWDLERNRCLKTLTGHTMRIRSVVFVPNSSRIVTGSEDGTARVWDLDGETCLHTLDAHTGPIWAVAVSADGQWIATAGTDPFVALWDLQSGELMARLEGHTDWITAVVFHPDGATMASGSKDRTARIWDVASGKNTAVFAEHDDWVRDVAFWPKYNWLVSGCGDGMLRFWDLQNAQPHRAFNAHNTLIETISVSPDQVHMLTGGADQTLRLWTAEGHCVQKLKGYKNPMWSVKFSADGTQVVTGSSDGLVRLWNIDDERPLDVLPMHDDWAKMALLHPTSPWVISGGSDKTIRIRHRRTGNAVVLRGHTSWISGIALHPNGRYLASSGGDHTLRVWDLVEENQHTLLDDHNGRIWTVQFSPDGSLLACGDDQDEIKVWRWVDKTCLFTFPDPQGSVYAVAFSPDGRFLYGGGADKTIYVWDLHTGTLVHNLNIPSASIWSIAMHPAGSWFAVALTDHTVRLFETENYTETAVLRGHQNPVWFVDISPDGGLLASCGDDQTARIWDAETHRCINTLRVRRPYEDLRIKDIGGLNLAQIKTLRALGAVE